MAVLFALPGYLLAGTNGVLWFASAGFFFIAAISQTGPGLVLKSLGAVRFNPVTEDVLQRLMEPVARKAGLSMVPRFFLIKSKAMNALSLGTRKTPVIAVTMGLVTALSLRELKSVLAHEIAHIHSGDLWIMRLADMFRILTDFLSLISQVFLLVLALLALLSGQGIRPAVIIILLVLSVAPMASLVLQNALSRIREYDADLSAARLTGDPMALASALARIDTLSFPLWKKIWSPARAGQKDYLFRSHPGTLKRIKKLASIDTGDLTDKNDSH